MLYLPASGPPLIPHPALSANQGFTAGRPGYCVNGHGFRHSDHQVCMSLKKPVAV